MKKIIAAAAGLMLVGSAVVASAAVEFSGDARARYYFYDNAAGNGESDDHWRNRVRLKIEGTTAGGAYAKTRFTVSNNYWGANNGGRGIGDTASFGVTADYAFVGVPMGCFLLNAGKQPLNLTTTYFNDSSLNNLRLTYKSEGTTVVAAYGVIMDDGNNGWTNAQDDIWTAAWIQDWNDSWSTTVGLSYISLQADYFPGFTNNDASGVVGVVAVNGQMDALSVDFEIGYQEEGFMAGDAGTTFGNNGQDSFGAWLKLGYDISEDFNLAGQFAYSSPGYTFDAPVGLMLIGGDSQLTITGGLGDSRAEINGGDDFYLIGATGTYQAAEDLGFTFNLGYADFTGFNDGDVYEVSGQVAYTISEGTVVYGRLGYAAIDKTLLGGTDDDVFGAGVSLELSF